MARILENEVFEVASLEVQTDLQGSLDLSSSSSYYFTEMEFRVKALTRTLAGRSRLSVQIS